MPGTIKAISHTAKAPRSLFTQRHLVHTSSQTTFTHYVATGRYQFGSASTAISHTDQLQPADCCLAHCWQPNAKWYRDQHDRKNQAYKSWQKGKGKAGGDGYEPHGKGGGKGKGSDWFAQVDSERKRRAEFSRVALTPRGGLKASRSATTAGYRSPAPMALTPRGG